MKENIHVSRTSPSDIAVKSRDGVGGNQSRKRRERDGRRKKKGDHNNLRFLRGDAGASSSGPPRRSNLLAARLRRSTQLFFSVQAVVHRHQRSEGRLGERILGDFQYVCVSSKKVTVLLPSPCSVILLLSSIK
ncbi:hypothetical protein MA16_Dca008611 [Dendrobium catenatum]|uniref:Uncharacterized protein n=1 Tax=Dendrobium catenatum TaxID=906689 RepID=A0A2I0WA77_9ASPA|nr:hypothetical protein MA16_Dca008611 [Dendrobium catenatum]